MSAAGLIGLAHQDPPGHAAEDPVADGKISREWRRARRKFADYGARFGNRVIEPFVFAGIGPLYAAAQNRHRHAAGLQRPFMAASYTHLAVYKRQILANTIFIQFFNNLFGRQLRCHASNLLQRDVSIGEYADIRGKLCLLYTSGCV